MQLCHEVCGCHLPNLLVHWGHPYPVPRTRCMEFLVNMPSLRFKHILCTDNLSIGNSQFQCCTLLDIIVEVTLQLPRCRWSFLVWERVPLLPTTEQEAEYVKIPYCHSSSSGTSCPIKSWKPSSQGKSVPWFMQHPVWLIIDPCPVVSLANRLWPT